MEDLYKKRDDKLRAVFNGVAADYEEYRLSYPEELFEERLKNILTDYSRYISETKVVESIQSLVETRSLRIVLLKTFDGLIAVRDNVNKPILYQNEKTRAVFYIISDNIGYIYIMKVSDFESSKKLLIEDEIEVL